MIDSGVYSAFHSHVFLGEGHEKSERKTWAVIWLCGAMMAVEIIGGLLFGSIALVADGLHMSTHAGALLLAALAYTYARKHTGDPRFTFGTGKLGDLAGFTSAIILAMIALLIGYESIGRLFAPVPIHFAYWIERNPPGPDPNQNRFEDQTMSVVTELFEFLLIHLPFLTAHAYAHALA